MDEQRADNYALKRAGYYIGSFIGHIGKGALLLTGAIALVYTLFAKKTGGFAPERALKKIAAIGCAAGGAAGFVVAAVENRDLSQEIAAEPILPKKSTFVEVVENERAHYGNERAI